MSKRIAATNPKTRSSRKIKIADVPFEGFFPEELIYQVLEHCVVDEKDFCSFSLVSKDFRIIMVKSCNLQAIQDKLVIHVTKTKQIQFLHTLVRNSHFDFSRAGGLDLAIELGDVNLVLFYVQRNLSPACIHGAIHIAAECGQTETLSILLSATKDPLESVILTKACKAGRTEVVKLLLEDGRIEPKSKHMEAACLNGKYEAAAHLVHAGTKIAELQQLFREVCSKGFLSIAKLLLHCYRTDASDDDNSALYRACLGGHYELAFHLLYLPNVSAAIQLDFETNPTKGRNASIMTAACNGGSLILVKKLLEDHRFSISSETLRKVAEEGHLDIMDTLLRDSRIIKDMAMNPKREVIYSNIMAYAACKGHLAIIHRLYVYSRIIKDMAMNPKREVIYSNIMAYAACKGHLAIIHRLYVYSFIDPFYGGVGSSMYQACRNHQLDVIQYFLQDSRCSEKVKNLCFYAACQRGNLDVAQLLYRHGANVLARTPNNTNIDHQELWLPFAVACQNGRIDIVKFLLQIELVQTLGDINSGLLKAANGGYYEIVELLAKNPRVDVDILNLAFRDACLKNHTRVVEVLLKDSRIDPTYNDNDALVQAVTEWKFELSDILMSDSRVDPCARDYMMVRHVILHTRKHFHTLFLKHTKVNPKCVKYSIPKLRKECQNEQLSVRDILNNDENKLKRK